MIFRRKPADPLTAGCLLCAYCISDYLGWERDPREGATVPPLNPAITVLPATVEGQMGGAALCAVHLRPLLRTRRLMAEPPRSRRATPPETMDRIFTKYDSDPMPRIMPGAARA